MAVQYRRMFLRWEVVRGWIPAILFTTIALSLEIFYFNYMITRGMVDKAVPVPIWPFPVSIALLLSIGNAVVLLTLWMSVFESTAYVRASPDRQVRRALYPVRMVRVGSLVLAPFAIVLFLPYILEANWFIAWVSSATTTLPSLRGGAESFYNWAFGITNVDASTRFIISQLSATLTAVVVSGLQLWRVRGTRNLMLLLRRRR